nr:alpha/beta fold hydrolase [Spongiactinospora gelatinilytica]
MDGRGTGESATPGDPGTYRADRLVADVEALRAHLALDGIDLFAHSAAADLAVLYAARHPERVRRLLLLTPGLAAAGIEVTDEEWIAAVERRSAEPWYGTACAALDAWDGGDDREEVRMAARPRPQAETCGERRRRNADKRSTTWAGQGRRGPCHLPGSCSTGRSRRSARSRD